jgi:hypothetical protein
MIGGSMELVAGVGYLFLNLYAEAACPLIAFTIHCSLAVVLCLKEGIFVSFVLAAGVLSLGVRILDDCLRLVFD